MESSQSLRLLTSRLKENDSFQSVVAALRAGHAGTIDGAWGSSKSLALAALSDRLPDRSLVFVVAHTSDVEPLIGDLANFTAGRPLVFSPLEDAGRADTAEPSLLHRESYGRRLRAIKAMKGPDPPRMIVTTISALLQPVPSLDRVSRHSRRLKRGSTVDLTEFRNWLVTQGWRSRESVELPGEFSGRGGILDLMPIDAENPLRIEFFGDEIESIREFSLESQRSIRELDSAEITALVDEFASESVGPGKLTGGGDATHFADVVDQPCWGLIEPDEIQAEGKHYLNRLESTDAHFTVEETWKRILKSSSVVLSSLPVNSLEQSCTMHVESVERFSGEVSKVRDELDRTVGADRVAIVCHSAGEMQRLEEVLSETRVAQEGRLQWSLGTLSAGFRWVSEGLVVISDNEMFHRAGAQRVASRRRFQSKAIDSFVELSPDDFVVHLAHGIAIYRGMKMLEKNDQFEEHLILEFADKVLVYVPASKMDLVQKYIGSGHGAPKLSKVGGQSWERRKLAVQRAVQDLAVDLLEIQAARQTKPGVVFPEDSVWQQEFESAFPFQETPDQLSSLAEIKADMESTKPMDRLLCGDVGYGKTELAIRAAFKAVDFGKQVALLVPTTVLAAQHLRTFRSRMAEFPYTIAALTRFETRAEQKRVLEQAKGGGLDILIGTHRLLSGDVDFRDLGLIIVDEEQRFGVAHKERLKRLRSQVDVLTLTATPIPRTLHSALLGIRDISNLETPPESRLAVETRIIRWDPTLMRHAILRELNRDGQIYFVHNRIQDIARVQNRINEIVPEARINIIHGQMSEDLIEERMLAFIERRCDILLATTIIESGLDVPNANTIFIDQGDHYGLADLHQLRGRVGRSRQRAYCYILIDERKMIKPEAQRRLKAIEEYSQLGAGFQIALRDLEIRGAGNILGAEQSGHIAAIGYELYCQLLENAVRAVQKQPLRSFMDVTVELPWRAYFPHQYITGDRGRVDAYRRLARLRSASELDEFRMELRDRFGPLPDEAENLVSLAELRVSSQEWQIDAIRPDSSGNLVMDFRGIKRIRQLEALRPGKLVILDNKTAYLRVPADQRTASGYANLLKGLLQPS